MTMPFSRRTLLGLVGTTALVGGLGVRQASATPQEIAADEIVFGNADAPLTILEYASLTCPHCAHFHITTFPELKTKYIDTGKVRLVFRDFPFDRAGLAGSVLVRCAGPQRAGAFLQVLYATQQNWATSADPQAALDDIAKMGGLPKAQYDACKVDEALKNRIVQYRLDAQNIFKITSTPSFVIDNEVYSGALSFEELEKIIKDARPNL
ncbi:DsbA family protein [Zavarzinia sp. CC-PAN008]|uniref:DsbA family protein n=1 Tax=Zavarzinia sp. CC-PAN008 TaxID=3243332 RepID=UPI003F74452D